MPLDIRVNIVAFQSRHFGQEPFGGQLSAVDAEVFHGLLGELLCVLLVENGEILWIADTVNLAAQKLDAETVDRADEIIDRPSVNHLGDTMLHLLCRLVGEGQTEYVAW